MKRRGITTHKRHTSRASRQLALAMATQRQTRRPFGEVVGDWFRSLPFVKRFSRWVIFRRA